VIANIDPEAASHIADFVVIDCRHEDGPVKAIFESASGQFSG